MPAVPFFQVYKLLSLFQNLLLTGVKIILEKVLLKKILFPALLAFLLSSVIDAFLRFLYGLVKIIRIHRLENIIRNSVADRFLCESKIIITAEDHDLNIRKKLLCPSGQLKSVHVRHLDICKKQIYTFSPKDLKGLFAVGGLI